MDKGVNMSGRPLCSVRAQHQPDWLIQTDHSTAMVPHFGAYFYHGIILRIKKNKITIRSKLFEGFFLPLTQRASKSLRDRVQADPPEFWSKSNIKNQNIEIGQILMVKTAGNGL